MFNLKLLKTKIQGMGYKYSFFDFFKNVTFYSIIIVFLSYFHHLQWLYMLFLIGTFVLLLPMAIFAQYKYIYEQKRFQELCIYLKQLKINFKTHKKILTALIETRDVFEDKDLISKYIDQAIESIQQGNSFRDSLNIIEKAYKNSYITNMHMYLILAETEGGETVYQALDNVDYQSWQTDTYLQQTQKYKIQNQNAWYTVGMLLLSLITIQYILPADLTNDMFINLSFQIYTLIYFLMDMIAYFIVKTMLNTKWIKEDE